jgi:competence protein ComGC
MFFVSTDIFKLQHNSWDPNLKILKYNELISDDHCICYNQEWFLPYYDIIFGSLHVK